MAEILKQVNKNLGKLALEVTGATEKEAYVLIPAEKVTDAARILFVEMRARFAIVTGLDTRDAIELLYHFCFDQQSYVVTLKALVAKPACEVESITPVVPAAEWIEREIHDLLGVKFKNHPNLKRLILSDDWPEGVYPLRKEYRERIIRSEP